jgi:hypothetical protein
MEMPSEKSANMMLICSLDLVLLRLAKDSKS